MLGALSSTESLAQTSQSRCQPVKGLREALGPVRSQGNVGWCYANAAADMLSYHYREELRNQQVSAIYIALKFNYSWWAENFREGGLMYFAFSDAMKSGFCPLFIDDELMLGGDQKTLRDKLNYILKLKDMVDQDRIEEVKKELQVSYKSDSVLRRVQMYDLITLLAISPRNKVLGYIAEALCVNYKHRISRMAKRDFSTKYLTLNRWNLISEINDLLDQKNPVGIAYFASFFDFENAAKTNDSRHMSVVVDRKWNHETRSCEFLVRNSWGSHCGGYKNAFFQKRCENGHVWVPEEILKDYLYAISFLVPEGSSKQ